MLNRHETPVLDHPIKIIYVDNDLVVLDKPCSLPVSKNAIQKNSIFDVKNSPPTRNKTKNCPERSKKYIEKSS